MDHSDMFLEEDTRYGHVTLPQIIFLLNSTKYIHQSIMKFRQSLKEKIVSFMKWSRKIIANFVKQLQKKMRISSRGHIKNHEFFQLATEKNNKFRQSVVKKKIKNFVK